MTDTFTIERLRADSPHVTLVATWTFEAWGHLHPGQTLEKQIAFVRSECGVGGVPSIFVALEKGAAVGTASLIADDMSTRPELGPWLASVFVLPNQRGRGIASRLVARVEQEALSNGFECGYLYTPDQQALYHRLGWRAFEEVTYLGEQVTLMAKCVSETVQ
ncbi:GNAT family N-acetyltransferase [Halomonas sp. PAMB 3264]|uniref:GNAT family N-acetyltransferase n=1 Tax=Halomonas sp. PAMB 3264 TaxID=3075222 RepID=UPI00289B1533|nr:GNAT family N-acetyltransferase [Halomonas sp. PAMB 3264]WNL43254.1 GNAT family N-acetyltransferase [Halomonas sp. PAMB 3264]